MSVLSRKSPTSCHDSYGYDINGIFRLRSFSFYSSTCVHHNIIIIIIPLIVALTAANGIQYKLKDEMLNVFR
jgi:ABC-type lipoprotein release transport system permease subunit